MLNCHYKSSSKSKREDLKDICTEYKPNNEFLKHIPLLKKPPKPQKMNTMTEGLPRQQS